MRRWRCNAVIFIFIMISALVISLPSLQAESGLETNNWWQNVYDGNIPGFGQLFSLEHEELELPTDDLQGFSREGQEKLYDVASRFGSDDMDREAFYERAGELSHHSLNQEGLNLELGEGEEQDNYTIASRLSLSAEALDSDAEDGQRQADPNFNLNYSLSDSMTITAGLGKNTSPVFEQNEEEDAQELAEAEEDIDLEPARVEEDENKDESEAGDEPESGEAEEPDEESSAEAENSLQPVDLRTVNQDEQETQIGNIGISYRPADNLALTADYEQRNLFSGRDSDSAVFGLEFDDQLGNIRASYQIEDGEMLQQTTTGLQMEVMDFARLSASYSLLDFEELEDKLKQQTSVDLGLDFNVTNFSTFSLGYQWQELPDGLEGDDDESNIRASFTIDF